MPTLLVRSVAAGALLLCVLADSALANEFATINAATRERDGKYLLDVRIEYHFSPQALEALDNGVPLEVELQMRLERAGAWFWQEPVVDAVLSYVIRFQPLSKLYQVTNLDAETQQNFATREAALGAIGELNGLGLVQKDKLDPEEDYILRLRVKLEIETLPLPLRPLAYISPAWNLASEWTAWPLMP